MRRLRPLLIATALCLAAGPSPAFAQSGAGMPSPTLTVTTPPDNDGLNLDLSWTIPDGAQVDSFTVLRRVAGASDDEWVVAKKNLPAATTEVSDKVTDDVLADPPARAYEYLLLALPGTLPRDVDAAGALAAGGVGSTVVTGTPVGVWLKRGRGVPTGPTHGPLLLLLLIFAFGGLMYLFTAQARAGKEIYIRRIAGIDAIEEGIGRATEMGKPVLYVPGIDELQDIQTIASMLILGQVSKMVAEYESEIIVSCCIPIVREVADEVVRAGFFQAGHPDAYRPDNTRFISSEQFAFCAGTNGIIYREKPATNLYFGRFFAESLILAETGFVNKSIQIAGTAEATQLPFFIAACDYTLIGEELFAVSAYLSRDPRLISSLKASDWVKVFCIVSIVIGTLVHTFEGSDFVARLFML